MKNIFISSKITNSLSGNVFSVEQNWYNFFEKMNINLIPINSKNFSEKMVRTLKPIGFIFPGGNDLYKNKKIKINLYRDKFEYRIIRFCLKNKIPLLGVCKGFQVIANFFNGKIEKCINHVGVMHNLTIDRDSRFINSKKLKVNSFHNYGVRILPKIFNIISRSDDQLVEIAEHKIEKILCFMFHPERYCESQKKLNLIIKNFFNIK